MNRRNVFFTAGMLAAFIALFAGCSIPFSSTAEFQSAPSADAPSAGGASVDAPSTGVQPEEFTVTLRTGAGGASRSVAGPGAGTIQYGSIRNTAQVIVVDQAGAVVDFKQARRTRDSDPGETIEVNVDTGETYHFLVLMGHQERDYGSESPGGVYVYKTDPTGQIDQAPTLLAAGLTTAEISGEVGETITVTMKPVVVDTVFAQGGTLAGAALAGVTLRRGAPADLTWTVTSGFAPLINAQKIYGGGNTLLFKDGATLVRKPVGADVPGVIASPLGGNAITLTDIGTDDAGDGFAYFNLKYAPFNLTDGEAWSEVSLSGAFDDGGSGVPVWIIRNGINDEAQNNYTVFPNPDETSSCPWDGTVNGNGAVRFSVVGLDLDLTHYIPAPVTGGTPVTSFAGPQCTGTVKWSNVTEDKPHNGVFEVEMIYRAVVTLTAASGWTFDGAAADSFTHSGADQDQLVPKPNPSFANGVVTITFPATTAVTAQAVDDLELKPYIPAPVRGGTPVLYFAGPQYRGVVKWYEGPNFTPEHNGVFGAGKQYKASVALTAASGRTFDGLGADSFTHSGADPLATQPDPNPSFAAGVVTITFTPTAPISLADVEDLDLTLKVSRPIAGLTPEGTVFETQYTGTVVWNAVGRLPAVTPFNAGTFYTATVTLTAAPGYTFPGGIAFTHGRALGTVNTAMSIPGEKVTVTINFPVTAGPAEIIGVTQLGANLFTPGTVRYYMNQRKDGGPLTITLTDSTETEKVSLGSVPITRAAGAENTPRIVTINGGGRTWGPTDNSPSNRGALITLRGDGTDNGLVVTLTNITILGKNDNNASLVKLENKARLVLGSGAIIRGNNGVDGGGVSIGPGSVLEMEDGSEIRDNTANVSGYGGGVYNNGGTFTMNYGSKLTGNVVSSSGYGGGVYTTNGGTFTMKAGSEISGNVAYRGGGVYVAGIANSNTVFEMSGGSITGNNGPGICGGVYVAGAAGSNTVFEMSGGIISENTTQGSGGGVYVTSVAGTVFRMSGGLISENKATGGSSSGGGVYVTGSAPVFEMTGGKITNNTATKDGGGVHFESGTFEMRDSEISGNTVTDTSSGGGGVYFYGSTTAKFTMKSGAKIFGNTALSGGGVLFKVGGTFTMQNNSRIYGNTSTGAYTGGGGGVSIEKGTFTMAAGSSIDHNAATSNAAAGGLYLGKTNTASADPPINAAAKAYVAGAINGNTATGGSQNGGGVFACADAYFELKAGGVISGNIAGDDSGGGVRNAGTFRMNAGSSIDHNTVLSGGTGGGGGVDNFKITSTSVIGKFIMENGAVITANGVTGNASGGGVRNAGTFTMNAGSSIDHNTVTGQDSGGGVCNYGEFIMGNAAITANEAANNASGGGVYMTTSGGTFTMDGGSINGNKITIAGSGAGGGVYINQGTFTMNAGSINLNNAGQSNNSGGGVNVHNGQFNMLGGSINQNRAGNNSGGGVFVKSGGFTITGPGCAINNNQAGDNSGGGALIASGTTFTVSEPDGGGEMKGNTATSGAGGVYGSGTLINADTDPKLTISGNSP